MKKIYFILFIFLAPLAITAQQDIMISQYMFNGLFLNPAYAGSYEAANITLLARKQWVSMNGAPSSQFLSLDCPLYNNKMGLGLTFSNDKIGVSQSTEMFANYAYHLKVSEIGKLAFGIRAGASLQYAQLTDLTIWDQNDQVFNENIRSTWLPNFGTGVYYYTNKLYAGLSVPTLISYDPNRIFSIDRGNLPAEVRHYYLTAGYVWEINENIMLKPSFLMKYTVDAPVQGDINMNVLLRKLLWLGASYRTGDFNNKGGSSIIAITQLQVLKNFKLGYAFDFALTELTNYQNGTHEVVLSYDFVKDVTKVITPRYF